MKTSRVQSDEAEHRFERGGAGINFRQAVPLAFEADGVRIVTAAIHLKPDQ